MNVTFRPLLRWHCSRPATAMDVLDSLEGWARAHAALMAGRGNVDDIEGFIAWYRARHTEGAD